ncbi:11184_t:CDS:2, partial [Gigaspora rosea]
AIYTIDVNNTQSSYFKTLLYIEPFIFSTYGTDAQLVEIDNKSVKQKFDQQYYEVQTFNFSGKVNSSVQRLISETGAVLGTGVKYSDRITYSHAIGSSNKNTPTLRKPKSGNQVECSLIGESTSEESNP